MLYILALYNQILSCMFWNGLVEDEPYPCTWLLVLSIKGEKSAYTNTEIQFLFSHVVKQASMKTKTDWKYQLVKKVQAKKNLQNNYIRKKVWKFLCLKRTYDYFITIVVIIINIFHGIKMFSTSWPIHFQEKKSTSCLFKENKLIIYSNYIFTSSVNHHCLSSIVVSM